MSANTKLEHTLLQVSKSPSFPYCTTLKAELKLCTIILAALKEMLIDADVSVILDVPLYPQLTNFFPLHFSFILVKI